MTGDGIAIVTVLHDSEAALRGLLASVERHLPGAHVVAVDSGSSDAGPAVAREHGATLLDTHGNVGFGRATNAGLAIVEEPVAVVANPDVELIDDSLAAAASEALRDPARILAPLLLRPDGTREPSAHAEPASPGEIVRALVPPGALPERVRGRVEPAASNAPRRVAWAVGACLVARTDVFARLGPFDNRAFMYGEDMDLGLRASDAGVETWFWPAARVVHAGAHASAAAFGGEPFELLARRRREVVAERRGGRRARADTLIQGLTFADRIALKRLSRRAYERESRQLRALRRAAVSRDRPAR